MNDSVATRPPTSPKSRSKSLALRFISGKYQGGEFPIVPNKEIVVGRSSELDMVLVEDMVSRKHARIAHEGDQIVIEDLGSTNGTFVNGEKVKKTSLKEGDRILIGTSILKVIPATNETTATEEQARQNLANVAANQSRTAVRTMSGLIEEVPLPDLLQLFATSKKNGVLVLRSADGIGRIYLRKGVVAFAEIEGSTTKSTMKSVFRLLTWQSGQFDLEPPDETTQFPEGEALGVQEILMESMRQLDEFTALRAKLPPMTARVSVAVPPPAPLRNLGPEQLDLFQVALQPARVQAIFDSSPSTDLQTAELLLSLIAKGYLRVDPS